MSIDAKSLRIGNKLQKENGEIFTVLRLDNTRDVLVEEQRGLLTLNYNLFGIPLSKEILEKCGFKKFNNAWVLPNYFPTALTTFDFSIWDCGDDVNYHYNSAEFPIYITSVHQLQNLFFCLVGEELTINL